MANLLLSLLLSRIPLAVLLTILFMSFQMSFLVSCYMFGICVYPGLPLTQEAPHLPMQLSFTLCGSYCTKCDLQVSASGYGDGIME